MTAMENFLIKQNNLKKLLAQLAGETTLIAPQQNAAGDILFLPVKEAGDIYFGPANAWNSPKEYFFPDSEAMFQFQDSDYSTIKPCAESEETVFFGVRACDTKAVELLDKFFSRKFADNFYLKRREKSTLITLGCPGLDKECFCTATRSGPFLENGFDLQLVPLNDDFLAEIGSAKGEKLAEIYEQYFSKPSQKDLDRANSVKIKAASEKPRFNLDKVYHHLREKCVAPELWLDVGQRCQSCGLCLFICPTCSCFAVTDRFTAEGLGRRVRQWDADYFQSFTRMAGNTNPIKTRDQMAQRKYYHKLVQQIDEFSMCGCTGCGRCNNCCVGEVNWLKNITLIEGTK